MSKRCPHCGGEFAESWHSATHSYMLSSPGCWAAYGEVLAREYADRDLFNAVHRLTVDAYALQHRGDASDRRATQSVWIHGASLWLVFEAGASHQEATNALKRLAKAEFDALPDPPVAFAITHAELLAAPIERHAKLAHEWARCAFDGWRDVHAGFASLVRSTAAE